MQLIQSFLTKNPCYTCGRTITIKGLMLHSVGCPQPRASVFVKNWNKASYNRACVHAFIDGLTGEVYQTLPWNRRGWHCASGKKGSANNTHIGVEMCEPDCIKYTGGANFTCSNKARAIEIAERTYKSAVELFAMLCKQYNLDPLKDGVILSHKEGSFRGVASAHGDPEHIWTQLGLNHSMDGFRKDVKNAMGNATTSTPSTPSTPVSSDSNQAINPISGTLTVNYSGGVNIRSGPSMSSKITQVVTSGTYTVVGISADKKWYKLKSGSFITSSTAYVSFKATVLPSVSYSVRVSVSDLRIRKGPGTDYPTTGSTTGKGVFTIIKESSGKGSVKGWGLLKSGAGWVSLDYAQKI